MARTARAPYDELVRRLYDPGLTPFRLPGIERLVNTLEFYVHHEDLRRAQPDWAPRELPAADEDEIWSLLKKSARLTARSAPVPVVAEAALHGALAPDRATIRGGADPVVVRGRPSELALFFAGRAELHEVTFDGDPEAVAALRGADLGM